MESQHGRMQNSEISVPAGTGDHITVNTLPSHVRHARQHVEIEHGWIPLISSGFSNWCSTFHWAARLMDPEKISFDKK